MTARRTVLLLALVWALPATLVTGCGGEDQGAGKTEAAARTEGKPLTVAEYRRRANALCARARRDLRQILAPTSAQQLAGYFEQVVRVARRDTKETERTLEPPPEQIKRLHERAVRLDARVLSILERAIPRLENSAAPAVTARKELRKLAPLAEEGATLARKLDLEECIDDGQLGQESGA